MGRRLRPGAARTVRAQAPNCAHAPRWATSPPTAAGSSPCYPAPAPRTGAFRTALITATPTWTEAARHPGARLGDPDDVYCTTGAPLPSAQGYRIVWVHSTDKAARDAAARAARIEEGVATAETLNARLAGPRCRLKTLAAVEQAAAAALAGARAAHWVSLTIEQTTVKTYKQARAGRLGPATDYRETTTTRYTVHPDIDPDTIAADAASNGCFPLITNDRTLTDAQILAAYRYQPNLERRHHLLKSVQHAAPVADGRNR